MKILLIRHGQTDWNLLGKIQGTEDIPLNITGKKQAEEIGNALRNIDNARIFSSPLSRAMETAKIISEKMGINKIYIENGLIERDFKNISGMTWKEKEEAKKNNIVENMQPLESVLKNMLDCIYKQIKINDSKYLIMVSHGAAINILLKFVTNNEEGTGKTILKNGGISVLDVINSKLVLEKCNLMPKEFELEYNV